MNIAWIFGSCSRAPSPFVTFARHNRRAILDHVGSRLDRDDALLLRLRYRQELTFPKIGLAMGLSEDAARQAHGRALERTREEFTRLRILKLKDIL